ncbi:MAG: S1 RNA-binding domain-containing protein [Deferribacteraceae bacterium]|jgi:ribosomal protein S1|nr:S1 RNA-binding domain-containing protein [Deferribacteraceae bacterium]
MSNEHTNGEEMRMEDFESMLEESLKQPTKGSTVKGVVAQIQGNEVIVNAGFKTEGVVDKSELAEDVKVGDEVELIVVGFDNGGYMRLSRRMIDERSEWNALKDAADKVVKVKIEAHVEKGYRGKIGEVDAFVPENHIDLKSRMQAPEYYIGKVLMAKVLKVGGGGKHRSALVSPKEYTIEQNNRERSGFLDQIKVGDVLTGVVKTLKDYGAFISFGAVDGFLHKSNIAWGRPKNPAKYMEEGQELKVQVLEINPENGKIEVGLKQITEDPWTAVKSKYPVDSSVSATIIGRRRNGYIAEIEPGVDAFIPLEELSWLRNIRTHINPKDVVDGRLMDYDDEHKRVVISVKMMQENPWKTLKSETPEGTVVRGTVKNVTDFGVFVDFGQFVDGLIRKSDISWNDEPTDLNAIYKSGDEIDAKILKIDEERERVSLGVKQLGQNPWRDMPKGGSKSVQVTITAVTKTGIEAELDNGLKGTIAPSDLEEGKGLDSYSVGDVINVAVVKADQRDRSVILSVRKLMVDNERKETKEYMKKLEQNDESQGFGNIFKDILK